MTFIKSRTENSELNCAKRLSSISDAKSLKIECYGHMLLHWWHVWDTQTYCTDFKCHYITWYYKFCISAWKSVIKAHQGLTLQRQIVAPWMSPIKLQYFSLIYSSVKKTFLKMPVSIWDVMWWDHCRDQKILREKRPGPTSVMMSSQVSLKSPATADSELCCQMDHITGLPCVRELISKA